MTAPLTKADLADIKRRCDAATPGEWSATEALWIKLEKEHRVLFVPAWRREQALPSSGDERKQVIKDLVFIAAARTDSPRLLAHIEALRVACQAALTYDRAIFRRGQDNEITESLARGAIAQGEDLDALYDNWITKARAALGDDA